jgi:fluoride exporter
MMQSHWPALLCIAVGAVLGAWARYGLSVWLNQSLATLTANLVGGLLVGLAMAYFSQPELASKVSALWRLAIMTGFLGALTTFSTFSAEVVQKLQAGEIVSALAIASAHLVGSLLLTALGYWAMTKLVS